MKRAVVLDARYRMSLPVIRSLGSKNIQTDACDLNTTPRAKSLGFYSRYTNNCYSLPSPDDETYIEKLKEICSNDKPVLLPCGIDSLIEITKNQNIVSEFAHIAVPSYENFRLANDKSALMDFADSIGIPTPKTTTLKNDESIDELATRLTFPVVIKYREGELLKLDPQNRYKIVYDADSFKETFSKMHAAQPFPLVQQYIEGDGFGVSAVFDKNHEPIEIFCHHRLREYPISGGPSSMCESYWDDTLVSHAIKLLKALNWTGVAMVEFKGNYLMEINPRFWGSLALAPLSGCNIPYALYRAALGETNSATPAPHYKIGKKMQFILQDTLSVMSHFKRSKKLSLLFKYLGDLLNPNVSDGVWTIRDIKSSVQYFKQALRKTDKIVR